MLILVLFLWLVWSLFYGIVISYKTRWRLIHPVLCLVVETTLCLGEMTIIVTIQFWDTVKIFSRWLCLAIFCFFFVLNLTLLVLYFYGVEMSVLFWSSFMAFSCIHYHTAWLFWRYKTKIADSVSPVEELLVQFLPVVVSMVRSLLELEPLVNWPVHSSEDVFCTPI